MLSENEIYITQEVKEKVISNPEVYQENLLILQKLEENPSLNPSMNYVKEIINDYQQLLLLLSFVDRKEEFIINSYYYFLSREEFYQATDLQESVAKEKAREDLIDVFKGYEQKEFGPEE